MNIAQVFIEKIQKIWDDRKLEEGDCDFNKVVPVTVEAVFTILHMVPTLTANYIGLETFPNGNMLLKFRDNSVAAFDMDHYYWAARMTQRSRQY